MFSFENILHPERVKVKNLDTKLVKFREKYKISNEILINLQNIWRMRFENIKNKIEKIDDPDKPEVKKIIDELMRSDNLIPTLAEELPQPTNLPIPPQPPINEPLPPPINLPIQQNLYPHGTDKPLPLLSRKVMKQPDNSRPIPLLSRKAIVPGPPPPGPTGPTPPPPPPPPPPGPTGPTGPAPPPPPPLNKNKQPTNNANSAIQEVLTKMITDYPILQSFYSIFIQCGNGENINILEEIQFIYDKYIHFNREIELNDLIYYYEYMNSKGEQCKNFMELYKLVKENDITKDIKPDYKITHEDFEKIQNHLNITQQMAKYLYETGRFHVILILNTKSNIELYKTFYTNLISKIQNSKDARANNIGYTINDTDGDGNCYYNAIGMLVSANSDKRNQYVQQADVRAHLLRFIDYVRNKLIDDININTRTNLNIEDLPKDQDDKFKHDDPKFIDYILKIMNFSRRNLLNSNTQTDINRIKQFFNYDNKDLETYIKKSDDEKKKLIKGQFKVGKDSAIVHGNYAIDAFLNPRIYEEINFFSNGRFTPAAYWGGSTINPLVSLLYQKPVLVINPMINNSGGYERFYFRNYVDRDNINIQYLTDNFMTEIFMEEQTHIERLKNILESTPHLVIYGSGGHWEYCTPITSGSSSVSITGGSRQTKKLIKSYPKTKSSKTTKKNIRK